MNFKTILDSLTSYYNDNVAGLTTIYENSGQESPESGTWCELGVDWGSASQVELGTPLYRHVGILVARIHTDLGIGAGPALVEADKVADVFRGTTVGSCKFSTPRVVHVGRVNKEFRVNVLCPFHCDEV